MTFYPTTLLPPYHLSPPFQQIDHIIMTLWDRHLELELSGTCSEEAIEQHLEYTAAVIEFWEEKVKEINRYEILQRRSNRNTNSRR